MLCSRRLGCALHTTSPSSSQQTMPYINNNSNTNNNNNYNNPHRTLSSHAGSFSFVRTARNMHTTCRKDDASNYGLQKGGPGQIRVLRSPLYHVQSFVLQNMMKVKLDEEGITSGFEKAYYHLMSHLACGTIKDLHDVLTDQGKDECYQLCDDFGQNYFVAKNEECLDMLKMSMVYRQTASEKHAPVEGDVICIRVVMKSFGNLAKRARYAEAYYEKSPELMDLVRSVVPLQLNISFVSTLSSSGVCGDWFLHSIEKSEFNTD